MTQYVVFNRATGAPARWGACPDNLVTEQAGEGEVSLETSSLGVDGNRAIIWAQAKAERDIHVAAGAITNLGVVDTDEVARSNIAGATLAALIASTTGAPYSVTWTMADNSLVAVDAAEMIAMGMAVMAHVGACHAHARTLRAAIDDAVDMAELLAIDVTVGWP